MGSLAKLASLGFVAYTNNLEKLNEIYIGTKAEKGPGLPGASAWGCLSIKRATAP